MQKNSFVGLCRRVMQEDNVVGLCRSIMHEGDTRGRSNARGIVCTHCKLQHSWSRAD